MDFKLGTGSDPFFVGRSNSCIYTLSVYSVHILMVNICRFKLLAKAFQEMSQDENNASEYKQLALYLVSEFFLDHRNKDVRLLVACCIADIFRVFAPDAPFTESEVVKVLCTVSCLSSKNICSTCFMYLFR